MIATLIAFALGVLVGYALALPDRAPRSHTIDNAALLKAISKQDAR